MYNRSEEKPIGKKRVRVINPKNNRGYSVEFIILRGNYRSLLGLRASQQMQLVTLNRQNILAIESSESSDLSERDLFVPIKKAPKKSKKSEDCLSSAVELIKKVVDNDPTKD